MVSCVRDVEIDLEDLPDRIVLNASVCPGKEVCAHLSKTWFIMDSVPDFELSDAKVRVYVNDEFQGLMRNDDLPEDSIHSRGQYVLPGCFVRQGDCLRIEAEADGYEPVSGETRIPGRARIYEVDTLSYRSSAYYAEYLRFSVKIGVETDSYYRLIVEQILDFRKIQNRKMKMQVQRINVVAFTRKIMENFESVAEEHQIDLSLIHI